MGALSTSGEIARFSFLTCRRFAPQADVHAVEANSGRTALHKAAFWGHHALCEMLLGELGLNPNVADSMGDTPLHDAARFGHVKVVQRLVAHGADRAARNTAGLTPLDVAVASGAPKFGIEKQWFDTVADVLRTGSAKL